jgi:4-hydroxy-2-oxoheptanedioate aldolase
MTAAEFAARFRQRDRLTGYWISSDNPPATERIARLGYDHIVLDAQHGLIDDRGLLAGLIAIEAAGGIGLVRVAAVDATPIGRALDAGAAGVIVPLINTADDAATAVAAARYPPVGIRSFGPTRSGLRIGPDPRTADASVLLLGMIETAGLDGLFVGPSDLAIGLGAAYPGDPAIEGPFEDALHRIVAACENSGIVAGIYCPSGEIAADRAAAGFSFVTVANDLSHLEAAAASHLSAARKIPPG